MFRAAKVFNNMLKKCITIVTYHRVTDRNPEEIVSSLNNLFVKVDTFEKQLIFFKKNYTIIRFDGLLDMIERSSVPSNLMLITFDDGYMDFYEHAYPIISKYNVPVTLFIATGKIGSRNEFPFWWDELFYMFNLIKNMESVGIVYSMPDCICLLYKEFNNNVKYAFDHVMDTCSDGEIEDILRSVRKVPKGISHVDLENNSMLSWEQIKDFSDLVEVGSHTMHHRNLKFLKETELDKEICESKRDIEERTGKKVTVFSYPNGYHSPEIIRHVKKAGYRFAVTTEKGLNDLSDLYLMKRINLWERSSLILPSRFSEGKLAMKLIGL